MLTLLTFRITATLETILHNILTEDKYLRNYRRSIHFGQNLNKDIIPIFLHAKENKTIELSIKILENLTKPMHCLLSEDVITKTDFGRQATFEINNLLTSSKAAFIDLRVTKVIIDFVKKNMDGEEKLSVEQCSNINSSLLLLRNILLIPEENTRYSTKYDSVHTVQNQIIWNIFSQGIDKILIKLMTIPDAVSHNLQYCFCTCFNVLHFPFFSTVSYYDINMLFLKIIIVPRG